MARTTTAPLRFAAPLEVIESATVVRLPESASRQLPSRGQVAVHGTVEGVAVQTVLEPDGMLGHWIRIDDAVRSAAGLGPGDVATLDLEVSSEWPEPAVPPDLGMALDAAPPQIQELWGEITPMARWEWVRWVNATRSPDTRRKRVEVSISKLENGKRRPCCFNLSACTDPDLSRNGRLIQPDDDRA